MLRLSGVSTLNLVTDISICLVKLLAFSLFTSVFIAHQHISKCIVVMADSTYYFLTRLKTVATQLNHNMPTNHSALNQLPHLIQCKTKPTPKNTHNIPKPILQDLTSIYPGSHPTQQYEVSQCPYLAPRKPAALHRSYLNFLD